jgi:hypothetical protein
MNFKLISKNNIGGAVLLLLIIALSQSRVLNFFIDTSLGRFFLIIFILCLSHCHKILGVVGVLFIIIMFNSNMHYEGFGNKSGSSSTSISTDASSNSIDASSNSTDASSNSPISSDQIKQMIQQQIQQQMSSGSGSTSNSGSTSSQSGSKKPTSSTAAEGFDLLGIENNIKRGKQSNSIPVNNFARNSESIAPYDGTSFLGSFSPF